MSAQERLAAVQAALTERGAKDVKMCFNAVSEKLLSQVSADVAAVLEAVVAGNFRDLAPEKDSIVPA